MNIKRVVEKDTRTAFEKIKALYGEDTAILSNKKVGSQVEVVVAIDLNDGSYALEDDPHANVGAVVSKPRARVQSQNSDAPTVDWMQARRAAEQRTSDQSARPRAAPLSEQESIDQVRKLLEKTRPEAEVPSPTAAAPMPEPSLASLALEMGMLRDLFQSHIENQMAQERNALGLSAKDMLRTLEQQNVQQQQLARLQTHLSGVEDAHVIDATLDWFNERLCTSDLNPIEEGGIYALVGLSGVGKTTTIAKLASQAALIHGRGNIALITLDHNRIGSREQMNLFGMMLGVDVINTSSAAELKRGLAALGSKRLVLIDTAGVSLRSNGLSVLVDSLMSSHPRLKVLLTLAANNQTAINQQNCDALRGKAAGTIVTKLDETLDCGGVVSALVDSGIGLVGACEGPEIPGCYTPMTSTELVAHWFDLDTQTSGFSDVPTVDADLGFSALTDFKVGAAQ